MIALKVEAFHYDNKIKASIKNFHGGLLAL